MAGADVLDADRYLAVPADRFEPVGFDLHGDRLGHKVGASHNVLAGSFYPHLEHISQCDRLRYGVKSLLAGPAHDLLSRIPEEFAGAGRRRVAKASLAIPFKYPGSLDSCTATGPSSFRPCFSA